MGQPGKYTYLVAENEEASPWEPLSESLGFAPGTSAVTILASEGPHGMGDHASTTPGGVLHTMVGVICVPSHNNWIYDTQLLVILCPEHAQLLASDGWSRADLQAAVFESARIEWTRFSPEVLAFIGPMLKPDQSHLPVAERRARVVAEPNDVIIAVAGGPGRHSAVFPTFGNSQIVSAEVPSGV